MDDSYEYETEINQDFEEFLNSAYDDDYVSSRPKTYDIFNEMNFQSPVDIRTRSLTDSINRKKSIIEQENFRFFIRDNPYASGKKPFYELSGFSEVNKYSEFIDKVADEKDIDARLIRAIMYMETTHGYYDVVFALFDKNKSILPMNINEDYWAETFGTREELKDPENNIRAGAELISRIQSNLPENASIEKTATLYNNLNATEVTDYGMRVREIYKSQPWLTEDSNSAKFQQFFIGPPF